MSLKWFCCNSPDVKVRAIFFVYKQKICFDIRKLLPILEPTKTDNQNLTQMVKGDRVYTPYGVGTITGREETKPYMWRVHIDGQPEGKDVKFFTQEITRFGGKTEPMPRRNF